jgi:ribosome-binding factor A
MARQENPKGKSFRLLRVGEQIRHIVAELLARGDVHDEVLERASITVSEVRISPDLRHATVYVEPLGGVGEAECLAALKRHARYLKGEVGKRMATKYIPDLVFRIDDTFANAKVIDDLLKAPKVARDLSPEPISPRALDQADDDH